MEMMAKNRALLVVAFHTWNSLLLKLRTVPSLGFFFYLKEAFKSVVLNVLRTMDWVCGEKISHSLVGMCMHSLPHSLGELCRRSLVVCCALTVHPTARPNCTRAAQLLGHAFTGCLTARTILACMAQQ